MVICLERDADLHMAQLMPLPLTVSCFSKIQIGFAFLVPAHPGSTEKGPLNGCVCACVRACVCVMLCGSGSFVFERRLSDLWRHNVHRRRSQPAVAGNTQPTDDGHRR